MSNGDMDNRDLLQSLRAGAPRRKLSGCPDEERLRMMAVGLADPAEAEKLLAHAATCDWCGTVLREAAQDLVEPPTEEELEFAASTKLADPLERRQMAARLAGEGTRETAWTGRAVRHWFGWMRKPVVRWLAPVAVAASAAVFFFAPWFSEATATQRLLARAYHEQRTSEFRLARADYAKVTQERSEGSPFAQPESLLEAEAKLARQIKAQPDNPELLRMQAEAEMMARHPAVAIEKLERASDLHPRDARILADLGAAYALRGDTETQLADYHAAIDYLSQSLHFQPGVAEVMFNRALVLEKALLYDQAVQAWQDYLRADSKSAWAAEARQRLADLQNKIKGRERAFGGIVADPRQFLALYQAHTKLDAEAYLRDHALTEWLPRAPSDEASRKAILALGEVLKQQGDSWLAEVAAAGLGAEVGAGFLKLAGRPGLEDVRAAEQVFQRAGSRPAELQARLQEVRVLTNSLRYAACLAAAGRLAAELDARPYPRMQAQVRIQYGICYLRVGQLSEGAALLRQAIDISEKAGFGDTALVATSKYLGPIGHTRLPSEVFAAAQRSLQIFWNGGAYPSRRYSDLVDELRDIATRNHQDYAAYYLARSAVWAASAASDPIVEAPARANLAGAAQAVGEQREARANIETSDRLFPRIAKGYRLEPQLDLARVELARGEASAALARLEKSGDDLEGAPVLDHANYYAVLGEACRRQGLSTEAMRAFRQSVEAGLQRLDSVADSPEKAGVMSALEDSYRGMVALKLAQPDGSAEALRLWREYRTLDRAGRGYRAGSADDPVLWVMEAPDGFVCWLENHGQVAFHRFGVSTETVATLVARFRSECSDPASDTARLRQDAQQLYQWMVAPFAALLTPQDRGLTFELDGVLTGVPVQALRPAGGTYLGERFSALVSEGASGEREPAPPGPATQILVVANPALAGRSAERFPSLPDSLKEADDIRTAFPAARLMEGRQATLAGFQAALPAADMVHFAGHGYTNSDNGALLFAAAHGGVDYELLRSADLRRQNWSHCRLAVLSACASAAGELHGAHNPDSLVRALIKAGVPRVAASLWKVDSAATAELMRGFYGALARQEGPAQALRAAQDGVRRQPGWRHPYYWAGFQLYGTT